MNPFTVSVTTVAPWIRSSLLSGPWGVLSLTAVACLVQVPITQYRTVYCISVGYGLAVAAIGMVLANTFSVTDYWSDPAGLLTGATIFYGLRLGFYLLFRDKSGSRPFTRGDNTPRAKRLGISLAVSILYACMTTPLLYVHRYAPDSGWKGVLSYTGAYSAWVAAVCQAIADGQKHLVKQQTKDDSRFSGPTGGLYRLTRHPNYTAEVLFWIGMFLTGAPSLGTSILGWTASIVGLGSILSIMVGATTRLAQKHQEKYGGQPAFEQWKLQVPYTLVPLVRERAASR